MNLEVTRPKRGQILSIYITQRQAQKLERIRAQVGLSVSQIMRALVDQIEEVVPVEGEAPTAARDDDDGEESSI